MKKFILSFLSFLLLIGCTQQRTNITNKESPKKITNAIERKKPTVISLGSFDDFQKKLDTVYDRNGIGGIVEWTKANLRPGSKIRFKKGGADPKKDQEIIIAEVTIEKLNKYSKETGFYYFRTSPKINLEKAELFASFRENFKQNRYDIAIYKKPR